MKKVCQHRNPILITDDNWNETLPVKRVLICPDCNTEIVNESLMMQNDVPQRWQRSKENENAMELISIRKLPLYLSQKLLKQQNEKATTSTNQEHVFTRPVQPEE